MVGTLACVENECHMYDIDSSGGAAAVPPVKTDTERICRKTKHSVKVFGGDFVNPAFMASIVKAMLLSFKLVRNSYLD